MKIKLGEIAPNLPVEDKEIEALTNLVSMSVGVTGKEDPHDYMRSISTPLINFLVENIEQFKDSPQMKSLTQLFLIEWCYRNGHLSEDWKWVWKDPKNGEAKFLPNKPMDSIEFPSNNRKETEQTED